MKANITLTAAALFLGSVFAACAANDTAMNKAGTPASKKECAEKVACRDYGKKCPKMKKCCIKNATPCASCGAPMIVVYELDDFFAIPGSGPVAPDKPEAKTGEHKHEAAHPAKPKLRKSIVKPVMRQGKDGKPEQAGYIVLFVDEADSPAAAQK